MKTFNKIALLIVSIVLAVGSVLFFAKTRVEPPKALKPVDQYAMDLQKEVDKLSTFRNDIRRADSLFLLTKKKIAIYANENKIDGQKRDTYDKQMLVSFVPILVQYAHDKFQQSVWYKSNLDYIEERIAFIKSLPTAFANMPNQHKADINELGNVLNRYRDARRVSMHRSFHGIAAARRSISLAREYANDRWLRHCADLVHGLNQVRPSIGKSHYYYVQSQVNKLANYRSYSWSYYDGTLVDQVASQITDYENYASELYGQKYNVVELWLDAKRYYNLAKDYYEWVSD